MASMLKRIAIEVLLMINVLVTGGCGFIGSNFVHYLLETDPAGSVFNFDALTYARNLANLADVADHPRFRLIVGNIADRNAVRKAFASVIHAVINFAAEPHCDLIIPN